MKCTLAVLLAALALAASAAPAQHWEFEQVDTVHWAQRTWLRTHPELGLVVGYAGNNGLLRIAWKDTAWNHLDVSLVTGPVGVTSFDIAMNGLVGVVATESLWQWAYAERRLDSAWQVSYPPVSPYGDATMAFDSLGRPHILGGDGVSHDTARVYHLLRTDSTWQIDTVARHYSFGWNGCHAAALAPGPNGSITGLYEYSWNLMTGPGAHPIFTVDLHLAAFDGDSWHTRDVASTTYGSIESADLAIGTGETAHSCCGVSRDDWKLWYDGQEGEQVASGRWPGGALAIDTEGHPLIACVGNEQALTLFSRDTAWFAREPGVDSVSGLDIVSPAAREALVSYVRDGIWLAHGVDIVGVEEPRPAPEATRPLVPTFARGVLNLPRDMTDFSPGKSDRVPRHALMDATGRRVMDLSPGPNDISHLSPGVYFVCPKGQRDEGTEGQSRKVVIQR